MSRTSPPPPTFPEIIYTDYRGEVWSIKPTPSGELRCFRCQAIWCEHSLNAVIDVLDPNSLWTQLEEGVTKFIIPVRPSETILPRVKLTWLHDNRDTVRVEMDRLDQEVTRLTHLTPFIGFLNRGEGRIHVRQMIVNWFEPELDLSMHRCTGRPHDWRREVAVQEQCNRNKTFLFTNCWKLLFEGVCALCWSDRNRPFDPDLIPTGA